MAPVATLVSARVDHDVRTWATAMGALGYESASVDGTDPAALCGDLVVIHDPAGLGGLLSPIVEAIENRADQIVFRHRDLPWQRSDRAAVDLEPLQALHGALHATANLRSRRELESRGFERVACVHDAFDLDPHPGDRPTTRASFGFGTDDIVLLQPTRGAEAKNFAGAVRYANELAKIVRDRPLRLWLRGPVDDDHRVTLDKLVERCAVEVTIGTAPSAADAFAACDVVVFPPTWDCFGDAVFEAIGFRRPCVTTDYPVLAELTAGGVRALPIDDAAALVKFLAQPESRRQQHLDATARRARVSFSLDDFPARISAFLDGSRS